MNPLGTASIHTTEENEPGAPLIRMVEASTVRLCFGERFAGFSGRPLRFLQLSLGTSYAIVALSHRLSHSRRGLDDLLGTDDTTGHLALWASSSREARRPIRVMHALLDLVTARQGALQDVEFLFAAFGEAGE